MIPIRDSYPRVRPPVLTWTLIVLNVVVFLWDRQGRISLEGGSVIFADLAMRPREVLYALQGQGASFPLVTVFTATFLHANLLHLLGNMIFLYVFGAGIEKALGPYRFILYYFFWGIAATATHIYADPNSMVPALGASGAIGGVLGAYFLLFPSNKIELWVLGFLPIVVSAWMMLGVWFLWQIVIPQQGIANWAHAGGFLAGMLTVLIMGGRSTILKGREHEFDYDAV